MKPSDLMLDLGRPVAYYPGMAKQVGGVKAAIFLCQFLYWTGKQEDKDGWIFKTQEKIEEETGLSAKEQTSAREQLKRKNLIDEKDHRLEHRMFYRVNLTVFDKLFSKPLKPARNSESHLDETPNRISLIGTAQSTTQNTNTLPESSPAKHPSKKQTVPKELMDRVSKVICDVALRPDGSEIRGHAKKLILWNIKRDDLTLEEWVAYLCEDIAIIYGPGGRWWKVWPGCGDANSDPRRPYPGEIYKTWLTLHENIQLTKVSRKTL